MSGKYALIIANTAYDDNHFPPLTAPLSDAKDLASILRDPKLCGFDEVTEVLDKEHWVVNQAIDRFLKGKYPDDLALLYFSGHGVRDEEGLLYLALKNTDPGYLPSTAIQARFVDQLMERSRSRRQVLILDCCYSGAIARGA